MKVLYCTRIFSGLEKSLVEKKWQPTGVPTIYKLLEKLEKNSDLYIFFLSKDSSKNHKSIWNVSYNIKINFKKFKNNFEIISGYEYFNFIYFKKLKIFLREIRQLYFLYLKYKKIKPDIIYFDNSNVLFASLFAKYSKSKVVLRIMGVYPFMKNVINKDSIKNKIFYKAYSSKFTSVICSQDGSGVEPWLNNIINKQTQISILMNGVDKNIHFYKNQFTAHKNKFRILFIGKLESYKGADTFVDSVIKFEEIYPNNIEGIIIGTGSLEKKLKKNIDRLRKNYLFKFKSKISHEEIYDYHRKSDIYVSLNKYGNLSNANLEAINAGNCVLMPEPDIKSYTDVYTKEFLDDSVIYISRIETFNDLVNIYKKLYKNKKLILEYKNKIKSKKNKLITWDERIDKELEILQNL